MAQAGPELPTWWANYRDRGLVPWGISIQDTIDGARDYWEGTLGVTDMPWAADQMFSTGQFFPGPMVGTPAYIFIDLSNMQIVNIQEGFSGSEEMIFEPYLD
jgi:hypothetical protein